MTQPTFASLAWHFGMKAHVGTDAHGIVHSLTTTAAHVADITTLPQLLRGEERVFYGDQAYWSEFHRQCAQARARGEHAFHVVKRLWGFTKVRYRGLAKNTVRLFAAFALANLYLLRRQLAPEVCAACV